MPPSGLSRFLVAACVCAQILVSTAPTLAKSGGLQLTAMQTLSPADFTQIEQDYFQKLDGSAAKNFIATRSYVRICQKVVDHKLPALQLPDKPLGFSSNYLLPGEEVVINKAIEASLVALMKKELR